METKNWAWIELVKLSFYLFVVVLLYQACALGLRQVFVGLDSQSESTPHTT